MAFPVAAVVGGAALAGSLLGGEKKPKQKQSPLYQSLSDIRTRRYAEQQFFQALQRLAAGHQEA